MRNVLVPYPVGFLCDLDEGVKLSLRAQLGRVGVARKGRGRGGGIEGGSSTSGRFPTVGEVRYFS